jgi:hypothetical protein
LKSHSPALNRRRSYRLSVRTGKNRVEVSHGGSPIELVDLSATGGQLLCHDHSIGDLEEPDAHPLQLLLPNGDSVRTRASVVRKGSFGPGLFQVGARWSFLNDDDQLKLDRFIACGRLRDDSRTVKVKNPMFIRNLLGRRADTTQPILSLIGQGLRRQGSRLEVDAVAFHEGRRVIRARLLDESPPTLSKEIQYEFALDGPAVTAFESSSIDQRGPDVTLALPAEVGQKSGRASRRVGLAGRPALPVWFFLPGCRPNSRVDGLVEDVARGGLRLRFDRRDHGLAVGDDLGEMNVQLPTRRVSARAVVRSLANHGKGSTVCGVELDFSDRDDAAAWRRFVFDHLHPNLIDGAGRAERTWNVLDASKYVELWTAAETREHDRALYCEAWQAPASEVGHSLLLCRRDLPVGVIAASAVYPRSFILHHLGRDARDDGKSQAGLKESSDLLCGILQRLQAETDFEHFLIYFERDKRFNEGLYVDFAERYFDKEKLLITSNEVFRRSTALPLPSEAARNVDVLAANPKLMDVLTATLARTTTPLEQKAMALDGARITLADFERSCAEKDYQRQRTVFFALEAGQPQAALIAELGSEGVNVFGLLNTCRIIALGEATPSAAVRTALLCRANEHYRAAGKRNFLFLDEAGPSDGVPAVLGFRHISGGLRWIAHRDVVPAWTAYLEGLLAASPAGASARPTRPHLPTAVTAQGVEQ